MNVLAIDEALSTTRAAARRSANARPWRMSPKQAERVARALDIGTPVAEPAQPGPPGGRPERRGAAGATAFTPRCRRRQAPALPRPRRRRTVRGRRSARASARHSRCTTRSSGMHGHETKEASGTEGGRVGSPSLACVAEMRGERWPPSVHVPVWPFLLLRRPASQRSADRLPGPAPGLTSKPTGTLVRLDRPANACRRRPGSQRRPAPLAATRGAARPEAGSR